MSQSTLVFKGGTTSMEEKKLEKEISDILRDLNIPSKLSGYYYLEYAILECTKNPDLIFNITTKLYPIIGKKFSTSSERIHSCIHHAIDVSWHQKPNNYKKFFNYSVINYKPKVSEFISSITDYLIIDHLKSDYYILKKITFLMKNLGIPINFHGYYYLRTLIHLSYNDSFYIFRNTKKLFSDVANQYHTSSSIVQRCINNLISSFWKTRNVELCNKLFPYLDGNKHPRNIEFIAKIVDELKYL